MEPLEPEIFQNGIWYELRGEQYYPCLLPPELQAIEPYGVWQEKKLYGKTSMGVVRSTYIIDEQGVIEHAMPSVKPDTNAADILQYLAARP